MNIIHKCGYISLISKDGSTVLVKVSKITHISALGNGGMTVINLGAESVVVQTKIQEIFEKIDAYIYPEMR